MAWTPTPESSDEQKFNMGLAELERIHQKFCAYDSFMMGKRIVKSFDVLKLIYDDIDFCLKEVESNILVAMEKAIVAKINSVPEIDSVYDVNKGGRTFKYYHYPKERTEVLNELREYHRRIRKHMKSHGLLMPEKEESSMF